MSYPRTVGPFTVANAAKDSPIQNTWLRGQFYAHGKHFIVYGDGVGVSLKHSSDEGATWSAPVTVRATVPLGNTDSILSLHFDGIYLHYALGWNAFNQPLRYRRGLIESNGSITWSAAEQAAVPANASFLHRYLQVTTDSEGFPVISYLHWSFGGYWPYVTKSSTNDGTWTTEAGYPLQLSTTSHDWGTQVISLGAKRLCVAWGVYDAGSYVFYNKIFDGSNWLADEGPIVVGSNRRYSIAPGPNSSVLLSYDRLSDMRFRKRPWGGPWGGEVLVYIDTQGESNVIARGPDANTIYILQFSDRGIYTDYVIYAVSTDGGTTWTNKAGGAAPEVWIDETTDDAVRYWTHTSSYRIWDGVLSFAYITGTSPYNVRYAALRFWESEDLKAKFEVGQGSIDLKAGFLVAQDSTDLFAKFIIRQKATVDLSGESTVRHEGTPVEVLGKAIVRQLGSAELRGEFDVGQDSAELLGKFETQATAELLGRGIIRNVGSVELLGNAEIRQLGSVELLGKGIIRQSGSAELLGKGIIRHVGTPDELLGEFVARQETSANLLGEFLIRHSATLDLLGGIIVRHSATLDLSGEFIVRQVASEDLLGELVVRHSSSQDLAGELIVRHSAAVDLLSDLIVRNEGTADLPAKIIVRHEASVDLYAAFESQTSVDLFGEFTVRQIATINLLGKFTVKHSAELDLPAKLQVTHSERLLSKLWIRHPYRLWTNRRYVNGVVELDETELDDALLEYVIEGVMNDIRSQLISEAMLVYDSWTDITKTPKLIRRATTYGTVASLYSRDINDPNRRIVLGLRPIRIRAAEVRSAQERAMDYWESRMEKMMSLYLTSGGRRLMIVDTEDEEAVFSMEDIPFYSEDPYKIKVR